MFILGGNGNTFLNNDVGLNLQGGFYQQKNTITGGKLLINGVEYLTNSNGYYSKFRVYAPENSVFGQNVNFNFRSPWNPNANLSEANIYIPKEVIITSPYDIVHSSSNPINVGSSLRWETDNLSTKQMFLVVEYDYRDMLNASFKTQYPNFIRNVKMIYDNGETILGNDMFEGIPVGVYLNVYLVRANYIQGTFEDNRSYSIVSYNYKSDEYHYQGTAAKTK